MDISGIAGGGAGAGALASSSPQASALNGMADAQARMDVAAEILSTAPATPEVVLDVSMAEVQFAASAEILKSSQDNTKKLLDVLA